MPKKLYFITTEIIPFANVSSLADFSTKVPLFLQENGHDIRTIIHHAAALISNNMYIIGGKLKNNKNSYIIKYCSKVLCFNLDKNTSTVINATG